jgi:hypothetical protein
MWQPLTEVIFQQIFQNIGSFTTKGIEFSLSTDVRTEDVT